MSKTKQTPKARATQSKAPTAVKQPEPVVKQATNTPSDKWLIVFLIGLVFAMNFRTISYDYTLDDPFFTKDNPFVKQGTSALPDIFTHAAYYGVFKNHDASYRPFLLTSFAVENQLFGFNPHISHFINLVFFALQLTVLFILLRKLFRNYSPWVPFFMLFLFAVHPIHTEVVASIKSRDEIMALLFSALCLLQSINFIDTQKTKHLVLSGVFFFCALMSKEAPITLVLLTPLTIYFFRDATRRQVIKAAIPYAIVAGIYMLMRASFVENDSGPVVIMVNNNGLKAATNYGDFLATALWIQLRYVILLVFPHPLSWDYSYSQIPIISLANPKALAAIAVIGALLYYAVKGFKKKDVFSYCIIFYVSSVIITSNLLVEIGATMAERFVFTASLAFCIAVVLLALKLFKMDPVNISYPANSKLFISLGILGVLYSAKTLARNDAWQNNLVLYQTGVETAPDSWRSHNLLAVEYTKRISGEKDPQTKKEYYQQAIEHFDRAAQILPSAEIYLLKGYAQEFGGHEDSAIVAYQAAIRLDSNNKTSYNNLGAVLLRKGRLDEAIGLLNKAVKMDTGYTDAIANLAASYGNKGMFQESIHYYMIVMRQNPNPGKNVLTSIGNVYRMLGETEKSQQYLQMAAKVQQ